MNCLWKSMILVLLFLVCTAFLFSSQAKRGSNLVGLVAWNNDHPKERLTEPGRGMVGLPMNGEARTKGLPVGLWGGEHISMQVTERRTTVEYDCAHATIDQRIRSEERR